MRIRPLITVTAAALTLAGCGAGSQAPQPSPPPTGTGPVTSARTELAARAAAATDLVAISVYTIEPPGGEPGTVMVVRAGDGGWRVDVPGGALDGTADVAIAGTADGLFQCALSPLPPGCVEVDQLTADIDPRVQHLFTDWPEVFIDRAAPLAVTPAQPLAEVAGQCYSVEPSAASLVPPVDAGVYCYQADGTLTGAALEFGTLRLVSTEPAAPDTIDLPGPVVPTDPLPIESPPPPSPTPSATASAGAR